MNVLVTGASLVIVVFAFFLHDTLYAKSQKVFSGTLRFLGEADSNAANRTPARLRASLVQSSFCSVCRSSFLETSFCALFDAANARATLDFQNGHPVDHDLYDESRFPKDERFRLITTKQREHAAHSLKHTRSDSLDDRRGIVRNCPRTHHPIYPASKADACEQTSPFFCCVLA